MFSLPEDSKSDCFRIMFQEHDAIMLLVNPETGEIIEANNSAVKYYGYSKETLCSMNINQINDASAELVSLRQKQAAAKQINHFTFLHRRSDGQQRRVSVHSSPILIGGETLLFSIVTDITDQRKAQEQLQKNKIALKKQQATLEESNIALKILMAEVDQQRRLFEEKISTNIIGLVEPCLEKLKDTELDFQQIKYVELIESNLKNILSPFVRVSASMKFKFTPAETQIAKLIRQGRSSKQIADLLNLSQRTIDKHRSNLRKKMGATNQKISLRTLLLG